jgi:hypothetical protein
MIVQRPALSNAYYEKMLIRRRLFSLGCGYCGRLERCVVVCGRKLVKNEDSAKRLGCA